jgi:hypothetical protein
LDIIFRFQLVFLNNNKLLKNICDYDIIVVEQDDKYPFNIGKLKNIGFQQMEYIGQV